MGVECLRNVQMTNASDAPYSNLRPVDWGSGSTLRRVRSAPKMGASIKNDGVTGRRVDQTMPRRFHP